MERKEAIEIVRKLYNESLFLKKDKEAMVTLIPELAESEDERIRKKIISLVKKHSVNHERCMMTDWLEKRGEQKYTKKDIDDAYLKGICDAKHELGKQGEQKSAEWNEEDEIGLANTMWAVKQARTIAKDENDMGNLWSAENWLKSLKDRVQPQPKQKWSEEDENMRGNLLGYLNGFSVSETAKHQMFDWLKSIKPQSTWKPSDEQMNALSIVTCGVDDPLFSLYQDLKKLREKK